MKIKSRGRVLSIFINLVGLSLLSCSNQTELNGDVTIENGKLAGVKISVIPQKEIQAFIDSKKNIRDQKLKDGSLIKTKCDSLTKNVSHDADFNTWTAGNEYLPVPQQELDVNKNLLPNPAN